jgi:hypothetical protein
MPIQQEAFKTIKQTVTLQPLKKHRLNNRKKKTPQQNSGKLDRNPQEKNPQS